MAKVSEQLDALAEIFKVYKEQSFIVSPALIGDFGVTLNDIAADARKLERMLERRLTSADIPPTQTRSADIIDFVPRRAGAPKPRTGGDVA